MLYGVLQKKSTIQFVKKKKTVLFHLVKKNGTSMLQNNRVFPLKGSKQTDISQGQDLVSLTSY